MSSTAPNPYRTYTIREIAKLTGISQQRLYERIRRGEGPRVVRMGRTIRVSKVALDEWLAGEREQQDDNHHQHGDAA